LNVIGFTLSIHRLQKIHLKPSIFTSNKISPSPPTITFALMTRKELIAQIQHKQTYLCVGLDTDIEKIPAHLLSGADPILNFNKQIIDATREHCVAYKINTAFFEAMGAKGWEIMAETFDYIGTGHMKIADAKRGDIGNTSHQYAKAFFETLNTDAVTVAPYMGEDSIRPFLEYEGKWTIVLGLTSNPGANDFERLPIDTPNIKKGLVPNVVAGPHKELLYQRVLRTVAGWGTPENLMFVVGATQASELGIIRGIVPEHFLLVPGVGAQGGSLRGVSEFGLNKDVGLLVNASRAVIYASSGEDFAEAAAKKAKEYGKEMAGYIGE
jgi:orotidine-5'-phosphate decarboxylase